MDTCAPAAVILPAGGPGGLIASTPHMPACLQAKLSALVEKSNNVQLAKDDLQDAHLKLMRAKRPRAGARLSVAENEQVVVSKRNAFKDSGQTLRTGLAEVLSELPEFPDVMPAVKHALEVLMEGVGDRISCGELENLDLTMSMLGFDEKELLCAPPQTGHVVHKVRDGEEWFAVKEYSVTGDDLAKSLKEAGLLRQLRHPCIVELRNVFLDTSDSVVKMYIQMPFLENGRLDDWVAKRAPEWCKVRQALADVLTALAHIHAQEVVHSDVKPANILVDARDRARLSDFDVSINHATRTATLQGTLAFTAEFAAPEVAARGCSAASDVFALGKTAAAAPIQQACHPSNQRVDGEAPPPEERAEESVEALIAWLTAGEAAERPSAEQALGHGFFQAVARAAAQRCRRQPEAQPCAVQASPRCQQQQNVPSPPPCASPPPFPTAVSFSINPITPPLALPSPSLFFSSAAAPPFILSRCCWLARAAQLPGARRLTLHRCVGMRAACACVPLHLCVCARGQVAVSDGVTCSAGHFVCGECVAGWAATALAQDLRLRRAPGRKGGIPCPARDPSPQHLTGVPCADTALHEGALARVLPAAVMALYVKQKVDVEMTEHVADLEKQYEERYKNLARGRGEAARKHVLEEVLTLKCPRRTCRQAFVDFNGCCALKCSRCTCEFCAWCLTDCGKDSARAHAHVASCRRKPPGTTDSFFASAEAFEAAKRQRMARLLRRYLRKLEPVTREAVLASIAEVIADRLPGFVFRAEEPPEEEAEEQQQQGGVEEEQGAGEPGQGQVEQDHLLAEQMQRDMEAEAEAEGQAAERGGAVLEPGLQVLDLQPQGNRRARNMGGQGFRRRKKQRLAGV